MAIKAKLDQRALKAVQDKIEGVREAFDAEHAKQTGEQVVALMKELIAKGISPIQGEGRFPAYKHQGVKGKYPDSAKKRYPGKRDRPVNLFLSGSFLSALKSKVYKSKWGYGFEIGYFDEREAKKERAHASGENGQPRRPTIPTRGEGFAVSIQRYIFARYQNAISNFLKSKK